MGDECPCDACACKPKLDFTVIVKGQKPVQMIADTLIHRQRSYIEWLEHQVGYFPQAREMRERLGL